jgi:2-amino-4-hydroxy-6-hydroxymethyldihydropteridine diphosphokinase
MRLHLIALGANLGGSDAANGRIIARSALFLSRGGGQLSRLYRSAAWPPGSGPDFVNAVLAVRAPIGPESMLRRLHLLERRAGRLRAVRWGPRRLDLDLIAVDGLVRPDLATQSAWRRLPPDRQAREAPGRLVLPHPRLQDRAFVLIPMRDVAPDWRHPVTGRSVAAMAAALPAEARQDLRVLANGWAGLSSPPAGRK